MTEKTNIKGKSELKKLELWEFQYYVLHFNYSEEELKRAVEMVGNFPEDLKRALTS